MQLANKLQTAKSVSFSLFMAFTSSSAVLAGGSVGVAGFVLPDGTVIEGLEIGSADFVNALYELRAGSNYHFQAPDTNITINRFNLIQGVPVLEGISDDQQKFLMLENSMIENNFVRDDNQEVATYYIRPDFKDSTKVNPSRLIVNDDVLFELSNIAEIGNQVNHEIDGMHDINGNVVKLRNCYSWRSAGPIVATSTIDSQTILLTKTVVNLNSTLTYSQKEIADNQTVFADINLIKRYSNKAYDGVNAIQKDNFQRLSCP